MKRIQLSAIVLLMAIVSQGQQLTSSSFHDMYGVLHNPATAGSNHYASIGGTFRTMWSSMPGAPRTGLVFANTYLPKHHLGLGGYIYNDVTGPYSYNGVQLSFAYHIPMKNNASFSLGLEGRFQQVSYDRAKIQESLGGLDPVAGGDNNKFKGDAGFGAAYTSERFQVGASVSQLIQSKLNFYQSTNNTTAEAQLYRHYYLHSYYKLKIDEVTKMIPHLLVIYLPNAPTEVQGGIRIEHNNLFWYGLALRAKQGWMISAGLRIKQKFNIGYSFDIYNAPLSKFDGGSNGHEIMLRYDFLN